MWQTPVINYFKLVKNYERQFKLEFSSDELCISVIYVCTNKSLRFSMALTWFKWYVLIKIMLKKLGTFKMTFK